MIQVQTLVKIIDNSGSKLGRCIKIIKGYKNRWTSYGTQILVSIKKLKKGKKIKHKVHKGEIHLGIILRTKANYKRKNFNYLKFKENSIALIHRIHRRPIGTRISGPVIRELRTTKFMKLASLSQGFV